MGIELVSACIFCASMLFNQELPPRPGLGADIGFSYSTLARRYEIGTTVDGSDITPKFLLIGLGEARFAPDGLGAGTPAFEWRARFAFGTSHDEQERRAQPDLGLDRVLSSGTGRYENFALLLRLPFGDRDSLEVAGERRTTKSTDLVNIGGENQEFTEARDLSAERVDIGIGWRHRWKCFEAEAGLRWVKPSGYNATARAFQDGSGPILGGEAEVRWRPGPLTLALQGQYASGSIDVHRESYPDFHDRDSELDATLEAIRLTGIYSWPKSDVMLTATYDRQRLPFVAISVLGTETQAFDAGYDPDSVVKEFFADLVYRYAFSPAIRARLGVRLGWGDETVTLTDSAGVAPTRVLDVARRGIFGGSLSDSFGSPEFTFFLGADFAIGTPK